MIPKIIHYCWFGGKKKSPLLQACIKSWKKWGGCLIIEWNETNCNIRENAFVEKMYSEKKYAFVSDYFRLKALYENGGIYLDTDVLVYKQFTPLLKSDFFCGFIYDYALGTAVIGAKKQCEIIKDLLAIYQEDISAWGIVNNGLFTEYFHDRIQGFRLNGQRQSIKTEQGEQIEIFPKETFETGRVIGRSYSIHFSDGSWHSTGRKTPYKIKLIAAKLPINIMAIRRQKKANYALTLDGKYQRWYREEMIRKNKKYL